MKITTVDTHTEGQATRIVVSGVDELAGDNMKARCGDFRDRYDHLRQALLAEPRGHAGMYGCVLVEPCRPEADFGAVFMHNGGYMDVSGQASIGVITALIETGIIEPEGDSARVMLDTPAGVVGVEATLVDGRAESVRFHTVPAWVGLQGASLQVPGHGEVIVDVAYGGNLFVSAWAEHLELELTPGNMAAVTDAAMAVWRAAADKLVVRSPETGDRCDIAAVSILDAPRHEQPALRHVQVYGPGLFGRSPGGTGAAARMAVMFARGEILAGDELVVESVITDGTFRAQVIGQERAGTKNAMVTEITGRAFVTGIHDFVFNDTDPLDGGFLIGATD